MLGDDQARHSSTPRSRSTRSARSLAVAVIDNALRQLERPVSSADPPNRPVVLVIRDPDDENQFVVDGEVETIDVDLGRGFDGPKAFADLQPAQQEDWTRSVLANGRPTCRPRAMFVKPSRSWSRRWPADSGRPGRGSRATLPLRVITRLFDAQPIFARGSGPRHCARLVCD